MKFTGTIILAVLATLQTQAQVIADKTISVMINKNLMQNPDIKEHLLNPSEQITFQTKKDEVIINLNNPPAKTIKLIDILKANNLLKEVSVDKKQEAACEPGGNCDGDDKNQN